MEEKTKQSKASIYLLSVKQHDFNGSLITKVIEQHEDYPSIQIGILDVCTVPLAFQLF